MTRIANTTTASLTLASRPESHSSSAKRVAVTGGAGFIGAAVVEELKRRGHHPVVIDRAHGQDVTSPGLGNWLRGTEVVIHLAGVLGTAELFDKPEIAIDVNVKGALAVLQACRELDVRFVGIAMPECWPNVYQATKYCAKHLVSTWHTNFGVPVSHVRAFNAYGKGQKYGPGHPQKIVPTFASLAWRNRPIPIWGDGTQLVDLIHTDDLARLLVDAMSFGNDEVFDGGTGRPLTVQQVAEMILDITGSTAGIEYLPMRLGETATDSTYARGEGWPKLDWRPLFDYAKFVDAVVSYAPSPHEGTPTTDNVSAVSAAMRG
jgi:UDP-glucose 4-epimerase